MKGLTEGRIVHFVMLSGEHRPAIVVKVWDKDSGVVNLTVFPDWSNDVKSATGDSSALGIMWATSVTPSLETKEPNTWHWIEQA